MRFSRVLRRAERGLAIAGPGRSRILLEMSHDLEGLYDAYVARGMEAGEAERLAEAMVGASPEGVAELARMHASPLALLLARYSVEGRHRVERVLLTGVVLVALAGGIGALASSGLTRAPSPFVWPLVLLGAVGAGMVAVRMAEMFGGAVRAGPLARLSVILVLAGACLAVGGAGAAIELWMVAGRAAEGAAGNVDALGHLARAAEVLTLALSAALALFMAWFHLRLRALAIIRADAEVRRLIQTSDGALR